MNDPGYLCTGQACCYDQQGGLIPCGGSGQDGEFRAGVAWPEPRFAVEGETVRDRLTGLVWSRNANLAEYPLTWGEALAFAARMNRGKWLGFGDWRLPNRRELRSLVSCQAARPALPSGHPFVNVFAGWYWTSTTAAISPAHAWYVDMNGGRMFYGGKDQSFLLWPVRGESRVLPATGQSRCYDDAGGSVGCAATGQDGESRCGRPWPPPRFVATDEEVEDRLTGLIWRREADLCGAVSWTDALRCVARQPGGWRLPNVNELESLVDCDAATPALPAEHPFRSVPEVCWSSTTSVYETDWAWALYVHKGAVGVGQKSQASFCVWAVRDSRQAGELPPATRPA